MSDRAEYRAPLYRLDREEIAHELLTALDRYERGEITRDQFVMIIEAGASMARYDGG